MRQVWQPGGRDNGAPGLRDYHPGYFAAFLLDPDGNNIEIKADERVVGRSGGLCRGFDALNLSGREDGVAGGAKTFRKVLQISSKKFGPLMPGGRSDRRHGPCEM